MEITTAIYCRGKLIEILERRKITPTDELTIESKAGGGRIIIKVDRMPTGIDNLELRINVPDESITNPDAIPPQATRMKKLNFGDQE